MINHSIIMFVIGWVIWFAIDKHPASLGVVVPVELDTMIENFQLAFDMLKAGFLRASYIFIWKAHYIVLSILFGLLASIVFEMISNIIRRRNLRQLMWPKQLPSDPVEKQDTDKLS